VACEPARLDLTSSDRYAVRYHEIAPAHDEALMTFTELMLAEIDREAARTRRVLEQVPAGRDDWQPHPKSMSLGRLAALVASMFSWFDLIINQDSLELNPPAGQSTYQPPAPDKLVETLDRYAAEARTALAATTDEFLMTTNWKLLFNGQPVLDDPRHIVLRDTLNHLAHHRGQLTVYLRLNDQMVPSVYGPTADDQRFL
jgi:uncharacterized damage-inducible protein DinB